MCPSGMARRGRLGGRHPPAPGRAPRGLRRRSVPGQAGTKLSRRRPPGLRSAPRPGTAGTAAPTEPRATATAAAAVRAACAAGEPCGSGGGRQPPPALRSGAADGPALINTPATCGMCARPPARSRGAAAARGWSPPGAARHARATPPAAPVANRLAGGGASPRGTSCGAFHTCAQGAGPGRCKPRPPVEWAWPEPLRNSPGDPGAGRGLQGLGGDRGVPGPGGSTAAVRLCTRLYRVKPPV